MKKPRFPYCWVINDTTTMIRYIGNEAKIRFRIGPHNDGDRSVKGMYVHYDDLLKLKRWFKNTGQRAEVDWTQEARDRNRRKHGS